MNMKVVIIQADIKEEKDGNINKILECTKNIDADIYCLPELFSTGFNYRNLAINAETISGQTIQKLAGTGKTITGTFAEKDNGKLYNTAFFISEGVLLKTYRKIHVFDREKSVFSPGNSAEVIKTKFGSFGFLTCYDIRFPEHARKLVLDGAEILIVPANFPNPKMSHWRLLLPARALENLCYIIAVNRTGSDENNSYFGCSMIINTAGEVIREAGSGEEVIIHCIDTGEIAAIRKKLSYFSDIVEI